MFPFRDHLRSSLPKPAGPSKMTRVLIGRVTDAVGISLATVGTFVYAAFDGVALMGQVAGASPPTQAQASSGGVLIAVVGLATIIIKGLFAELRERRQFQARQDDSLRKLAQAQADAAAAASKLKDTQELYEKMCMSNAELRDKMKFIDDNSRKLVDMQESVSALQKSGYFRHGDDEDSDVKIRDHVVVVEDDDETSALLYRLFRAKGYICHRAATVAEAKVKIARHDPRWVILDLVLADGTGVDVLQFVRNSKGRFQAKVFVVTGAVDSAKLDQVAEFHPDAVLTKPFDFSYMADLMAVSDSKEAVIKASPPGAAPCPDPKS
jgi:CheY-like chemotaxis protein